MPCVIVVFDVRGGIYHVTMACNNNIILCNNNIMCNNIITCNNNIMCNNIIRCINL